MSLCNWSYRHKAAKSSKKIIRRINYLRDILNPMLKHLIILPCLLMMFQPLNAKVDPPNYDFSLKTLEPFFPGKNFKDAGTGIEMNSVNGMKTHKFMVEQIRYKFPVLVQEKDGIINDFFARLPSYFLHDIFLQSLVNKLGKQTSYKRTGEEAFYVWEKDDQKHVYSAACTITCFPIFYTVMPLKGSNSLMDQMKRPGKL